jgi:4-diphosphocytidyl-2-C-methyl-D-erythritol kinase
MPTIAAPAKINLHLDILDRREDGYHNLSTVFQAIDWCDTLAGEPADVACDALEVSGPFAPGIPTDGSNLVLRAVALFRREIAPELPPLRLQLWKNLPSQAGLGGGSSDAVAALKLAARIAALHPGVGAMEALAARLGSDCPFFVRGGCQAGGGRGEVLAPVPNRHDFGVVVVVPPVGVSTPQAFAALTPEDKGLRSDHGGLLTALANPAAPLPRLLVNSFERGVAARVPGIAAALAALRATDPLLAMLSGSGSACYALYPDEDTARAAAGAIPATTGLVHACRFRAAESD